MDILSSLADKGQWEAFLQAKQDAGHLRPEEEKQLREYIAQGRYRPYVEGLLTQPFSPPRRIAISKMHSEKKRIVYIFDSEQRNVLKFLTYLLQRKYDRLFSRNLYSFRPGYSVRTAYEDLMRVPNLKGMYSYKVDISNYFNSIPISRLLPDLEQILSEDPGIYSFLAALLQNPVVLQDGKPIQEPEKGIMAGTPVSTFLANVYLRELDQLFENSGRVYARYSDDIITFAPTEEALEENIRLIHEALAQKGLSINPKKESRTAPGESWVFLGFLYDQGKIDIAPASVEKLKAKMRRKSRALLRWRLRKNASGENAAKAFIRVFNRKLFDNPIDHELTWARWYFPMITTTESLQKIDQYCQSCIRYLATGQHNKTAYRFRYEDMKALGYLTLVNQYYQSSKNDS